MPESLIESGLFGHEKAAFTGADSLRKGQFELADGSTIFLDEIGDIPALAQVKLLWVIQECQVERLNIVDCEFHKGKLEIQCSNLESKIITITYKNIYV